MQSALSAVKGVSKATVSMPNKAVVTTSKEVTIKSLTDAVKTAGYSATEAKKTEAKK